MLTAKISIVFERALRLELSHTLFQISLFFWGERRSSYRLPLSLGKISELLVWVGRVVVSGLLSVLS